MERRKKHKSEVVLYDIEPFHDPGLSRSLGVQGGALLSARFIRHDTQNIAKQILPSRTWVSAVRPDSVTTLKSMFVIEHRSSIEESFSRWLKNISNLDFDLSNNDDFGSLSFATSQCWQAEMPVKKLINAIRDYAEEVEQGAAPISELSARSYLVVAVLLVDYDFQIYFDASNGCVSVDIFSEAKEILAAQFSSDCRVHYSLAGRGKRIFKVSGTAKFKDEADFVNFDKVLRML